MKLSSPALCLALMLAPAIAGPSKTDKTVNPNRPGQTSIRSPFRTFRPAAPARAIMSARRPELSWTDNPAETLHYDGPNNDGVGLTDGGTFYGAVRFTPTQSCSLKTAVFPAFHAVLR